MPVPLPPRLLSCSGTEMAVECFVEALPALTGLTSLALDKAGLFTLPAQFALLRQLRVLHRAMQLLMVEGLGLEEVVEARRAMQASLAALADLPSLTVLSLSARYSECHLPSLPREVLGMTQLKVRNAKHGPSSCYCYCPGRLLLVVSILWQPCPPAAEQICRPGVCTGRA